MTLQDHLSREANPTVRFLADARYLQGMASSFATFNEAACRHLAGGESILPDLLLGSYEDVSEVLQVALTLTGPIEPELLAAIECLQAQKEAARELLP